MISSCLVPKRIPAQRYDGFVHTVQPSARKYPDGSHYEEKPDVIERLNPCRNITAAQGFNKVLMAIFQIRDPLPEQ